MSAGRRVQRSAAAAGPVEPCGPRAAPRRSLVQLECCRGSADDRKDCVSGLGSEGKGGYGISRCLNTAGSRTHARGAVGDLLTLRRPGRHRLQVCLCGWGTEGRGGGRAVRANLHAASITFLS